MQDSSFYDYLVNHGSMEGEEIGWWEGSVATVVGCRSPVLMERSKPGGGEKQRGEGRKGWAVTRDRRLLTNDHPIQACHPAERVITLAWMDGRRGNLSHGEQGGIWTQALKRAFGPVLGGLDKQTASHKIAKWIRSVILQRLQI